MAGECKMERGGGRMKEKEQPIDLMNIQAVNYKTL